MNTDIKKLQPNAVWERFAEICAIPRPSNHEEQIRAYIVDFARRHNLEYSVDGGNNILIRKPAAPGMENRRTVVMQAHLDMVPQKNSDKVFDFEKDPIEAYVDGEWVTANGTTLGADNGMGVAAMLAVLEDGDMKHGPLEALFTATEETGMDGAFGLKSGVLAGDILLNLDSETEGELYVGCAGGLDFNAKMQAVSCAIPRTDRRGLYGFRLEIKGLKGGHSGIEIVLQRANANKLLARYLKNEQDRVGILLCDIDGGGLRNAIPREAFATVAITKDSRRMFLRSVGKFEKLFRAEFKGIEDNISFKAVPVEVPHRCLVNSDDLIDVLVALPNGVIRMSPSMPGLVQTSTNLARVYVDNGWYKIQCLLRSSVNSEKDDLAMQMRTIVEMAGGVVKLSGAYNGWNPNPDSPILATMSGGYEELFGRKPAVTAIHAGLECGIIGGTYPSMDMISFGPTICYPHSPDEKVNIASVERFWKFLRHTLENAPLK